MTATVGDALPACTLGPIESDVLAELAVVLADPNPIHLDAAVVAELGLGDRQIVQGPLTLGALLSMLDHAFPGCTVRAIEVRFLGNVFAGDTLTCAGRVVDVTASTTTCDVWAEVDGRMVMSGTAEVVADERG